MTLSNFYNFERTYKDGGPVVRVPRGMAIENYRLEFCLEWDTGAAVIDVPAQRWEEHDEVIGVWAPELQHEGGVRGIRLDDPDNNGAVWEPPLAPNRPKTNPYEPVTEMEVDVRRRTSWGFRPTKGMAALSRLNRRLLDWD